MFATFLFAAHARKNVCAFPAASWMRVQGGFPLAQGAEAAEALAQKGE